MIVQVKVKPSSREFKIERKDRYWVIYLKSKPENNRANIELVRELTRMFGKCRILKGKTSKNKTVEIG